MRNYLLLLCFLTLLGCHKEPEIETVFTHQPGMRAQLPSGWVVDELDPNRPESTSWRDHADTAKINVAVELFKGDRLETLRRFPAGNRLGPLFKAQVEGLEHSSRVTDFKLVEERETTLGGQPAREVIFTGVINQRPRYRRMVFALDPNRDDRLVMVSYLCDPGKEKDFEEAFEQVLSSWEWGDGAKR